MSEYYQNIDRPHFDYGLVKLEGTYLHVRGPAVDLSKPYIACVGAAQTFGRFCDEPYPTMLGKRLGMPVLNLSDGGAGPGWVANPVFLRLLNGASLVVVQMLSARSVGNSLFDNRNSGGHVGTRLADGKRMTFIEFFKELVASSPPGVVARVVQETRENFVRRSIEVLGSIRPPKVALWLSARSPDYEDRPGTPHGYLSDYPHFVNREMVKAITAHADAYVECSSAAGLPQPLWQASAAVEGAVLVEGRLFNRYYPSPQMHRAAADALESVCRGILQATARPLVNEPTQFLIVSAGRTGSNLLRSLLDSHPAAFCGGEVFNKDFVAKQGVPWPIGDTKQDPELRTLMLENPGAYYDRLLRIAKDAGYGAIGAKLTYENGASHPAASERLAGDPRIRVIHLQRKNLLRQYVSLQRAFATGQWTAGTAAATPLPPVEIDFVKCVWFFLRNRELQATADRVFANHPKLTITYEELSADPQRVGRQCVEFLGLDPSVPLKVGQKKSATDTLREAIANYDELKAQFAEWAGFFDD
ncbi:MAG: DUF6473 family protein [Planctomycetes bacterium]|nr:DUF6473 family protein [Planctomycetota bacterium]MCC7399780.1 hypothetical protein [Planctomycetota bacterium]